MEHDCECACCGQVTIVDSAYKLCARCYEMHIEEIQELEAWAWVGQREDFHADI